MYGLVVARMGNTETMPRFFRQTAAIDLKDTHGADGDIHIAAPGDIWMPVEVGFAKLSLRNDGLALDSHLLTDWNRMTFRIQSRRHTLGVRIDQTRYTIEGTRKVGKTMALAVGGEPTQLQAKAPVYVRMRSGAQR